MYHPLANMDFDELYTGMQLACLDGYVNEIRDGDLSLFNYTQKCVMDKAWDDFTKSARGLIVDRKAKKVVAYTFPKFFNYGEVSHEIPDEPFEVFEKYDGSLGIVFHHDGKWRVATRGSFNSDQAQWATKFLNRVDLSGLNPSYTYLVEIIYPENKIVIPYDFENLILLGVYNSGGKELTFYDIVWPFGGANKQYYSSIDTLLKIAKQLPYDDEGFVVRFTNGYRLKIKGDEYVRIHRIISQVTPLGVWRILINKMDWNSHHEFLSKIPEEVQKDYLSMRQILVDKTEAVYQYAHREYAKAHKKTHKIQDETEKRKQFALLVKDKEYFDIIMQIYKSTQEQGIRASILRKFKPVGNILEGYVPSNVMNRFADVANN